MLLTITLRSRAAESDAGLQFRNPDSVRNLKKCRRRPFLSVKDFSQLLHWRPTFRRGQLIKWPLRRPKFFTLQAHFLLRRRLTTLFSSRPLSASTAWGFGIVLNRRQVGDPDSLLYKIWCTASVDCVAKFLWQFRHWNFLSLRWTDRKCLDTIARCFELYRHSGQWYCTSDNITKHYLPYLTYGCVNYKLNFVVGFETFNNLIFLSARHLMSFYCAPLGMSFYYTLLCLSNMPYCLSTTPYCLSTTPYCLSTTP